MCLWGDDTSDFPAAPARYYHGIRSRSRKKPPLGPSSGSVASQRPVSAPSSGVRGAARAPPAPVIPPPITTTRLPSAAIRSASSAEKASSTSSEYFAASSRIAVFADRSFTFELKTPPAAVLLKRAAQVDKGSGTPKRSTAGSVTDEQIREIAETKMPDLNAYDLDSAKRIVAGTARSMGLDVVEG